jgi:DNA-directed RNA polymerase specialized sigma24 family protein
MHDNVRSFPWKKNSEASAADLLRECGTKLTDRTLWAKFQERFQRLIFLYVLRALGYRSVKDDAANIVPDLAQEVYLRLVQHDGRILRSFRGTSEFSVRAFLSRISATVVLDYQRRNATGKRHGQVVDLESYEAEVGNLVSSESSEFHPNALTSILSWIDIERMVEAESDQKNAHRNALIFKLHYIDGFSSAEISRFPGFDLTKTGVEAVLSKMKKRIQQ